MVLTGDCMIHYINVLGSNHPSITTKPQDYMCLLLVLPVPTEQKFNLPVFPLKYSCSFIPKQKWVPGPRTSWTPFCKAYFLKQPREANMVRMHQFISGHTLVHLCTNVHMKNLVHAFYNTFSDLMNAIQTHVCFKHPVLELMEIPHLIFIIFEWNIFSNKINTK